MSEKGKGAEGLRESTVLVGKKPVMNYVTACLAFFNAGSDLIVLKARGRSITKAVDTVELLRRAFIKQLKVEDIKIGTEEVEGPEGRTSYVSTIEIRIARPAIK